jgi:hypothetical protein
MFGYGRPARETRPPRKSAANDPNSLHTISHNGSSTQPVRLLELRLELHLQILRISFHFASRNLRIRGAVKAKLANSQPLLRSHRRTKRSARHRPRFVEFAQARLRIEQRTHFLIRKIRKTLLGHWTFSQHTRFRVARKIPRQSPDRIPCPRTNAPRPRRVCLLQTIQSLPQPCRIHLADREYANTALRASRTAHEPLAAASRCIRQCSIHNLNQRAIPVRQSRQSHSGSIQDSCCAGAPRTVLHKRN